MSEEKIHIPDLRTYAYHKRASEILLEKPERLEEIYEILNNWATMQDTQAQGWAVTWLTFIEGLDAAQVSELIIQKGETFDFFRKSSPFAALLTEEERHNIINTYKYNYE